MRGTRLLLGTLLLLAPGTAHAAVQESTSADAWSAPATDLAHTICLPVFLEVDPPWVTPVLRPECIQQTVQDVRELIGI